MNLPDKTIERLSQYRRNLLISLNKGKEFIFSHEIAQLLHITPVQVRRDIMLIGYNGTLRKGYDVKELIDLIGKIIDTEEGVVRMRRWIANADARNQSDCVPSRHSGMTLAGIH